MFIYENESTLWLIRLKQCLCPRTTVHFCLAPDHYCSCRAWCPLIPVRRWPKLTWRLNGSLMAQFSKGTFIYLKLSTSANKNPIYLINVRRHSKCWSLFCNNIINSLRFQLWGFSIGSGRLPGTPGDQVPGLPAHNLTCQCYAASRRKNQSAVTACQYLTNQKHWHLYS